MKTISDTSTSDDLAGYEVLVCVCGGIAAYKVCELVSRLVQRGCGVTVAMTESACRFVGPVTFQALSGRRVLTNLWVSDEAYDVQHIEVNRLADLVCIAPATANILGKMAGGIADDLVSTLLISAAPPVVVAPTMNSRMWANPIVQQNIARLTELGHAFIGPKEGWLACRKVGPGRMAEAGEILETLVDKLKAKPARTRAGEP